MNPRFRHVQRLRCSTSTLLAASEYHGATLQLSRSRIGTMTLANTSSYSSLSPRSALVGKSSVNVPAGMSRHFATSTTARSGRANKAESTSPSKPGLAALRVLVGEAISLRARYQIAGSISNLEGAAEKIKACLTLIETEAFQVPEELWPMLTLPFETLGGLDLLERAVTALRGVVEATPETHASRIPAVLAFANSLNLLAGHTGNYATRAELLELCDKAIDSAPSDKAQLAALYLSMQRSIRNPYDFTPCDNLKLAAGFGKLAVDIMPPAHPLAAVALTEFAISARMEYELLEENKREKLGTPVLVEALRLLDQALTRGNIDRMYRPWILTNRGMVLRYLAGDENHAMASDAMKCFIDALEAMPPQGPDRPYPLMGLALVSIRMAAVMDFDKCKAHAIKFLQAARRIMPDNHIMVAKCEQVLDAAHSLEV
jgi:hypothetical protein